jgi:1L-myo-inositol 1-phosphate cytidylyltransferase
LAPRDLIDTAILLAAGQGTRLRSIGSCKPLCPVGGKPLIDHAIERLALAGLSRAVVVTGFQAEQIESHVAPRRWPLAVETVRTDDWRQPNGVSARAAGRCLKRRSALLVMCDHIVEPELYRRAAQAGPGEGLTLCIDRRLDHPWVDEDDVTCVRTDDDGRILAIGKRLRPHDAHDMGVFAVGPPFFSALEKIPGASVTDGVQTLAHRGAAGTIDCSDLKWIDVDDETALRRAESWLRSE